MGRVTLGRLLPCLSLLLCTAAAAAGSVPQLRPPNRDIQRQTLIAAVAHMDRGNGAADLFPVTAELVRRAEGSDHDAHLAFELAMAAASLIGKMQPRRQPRNPHAQMDRNY